MANVVEDEVIKAEIQDGLSQVDESLVLSEFETVYEKSTRKLRIYIKATNEETKETIEINEVLG